VGYQFELLIATFAAEAILAFKALDREGPTRNGERDPHMAPRSAIRRESGSARYQIQEISAGNSIAPSWQPGPPIMYKN
jgi:hypothetical protein